MKPIDLLKKVVGGGGLKGKYFFFVGHYFNTLEDLSSAKI